MSLAWTTPRSPHRPPREPWHWWDYAITAILIVVGLCILRLLIEVMALSFS